MQFIVYTLVEMKHFTVNYERHFWCPGYNYQNIKNKKLDVPYHIDDGIFKINLKTGESKTIVKLKDIIFKNKLNKIDSSNHWLEHIMYNPKGDRFSFFHRWEGKNDHGSRVYLADSTDGANKSMLPDTGFYSHYYWKDSNNFSIWTYHPDRCRKTKNENKIKKLDFIKILKKNTLNLIKSYIPDKILTVIKNNAKLIIFSDYDLNFKVIDQESLHVNGHQSWFKDSEKVLNDSYQDEDGFRHISIVDTINLSCEKVGKFFSLYNNNVFRCDLHPRLSSDNRLIIIDTAHESKRMMIVISNN